MRPALNHRTPSRRSVSAAGLAALVLVTTLAACGGDDDEPTASGPGSGSPTEPGAGDDGSDDGSGDDDGGDGGDGTTLTVGALDTLAFDPSEYEAAAGEITFVYENEGNLPHTLLIDGVEGFKLAVGDTDEGSVELEPGTYTLYCDVAGHRAGGMEAELTVE